ncbi:lon protease homolog, mitochondrial-like [Rutidosis leptorrhynchoides]|uniref:lon protease homolog, mitochondrial-like n=1 Tax=Rutidosis leptorrhynchoides TaxID=125765 RepID=UPI003A9A5C42
MEYKIIIKELGVDRNDKTALIDKFRARIDANKAKIPPHVLQVMEEEMKKLQDLKSISTKFINTCDYLGWFSDYLGWSTALPPSCYSPVSK